MAIYPKMNLAQLRVASRQRADMVNSTFVTDDELNSYINASYYELYDLLVQKYGDDYYVEQYSFSLQQNESRYELPANFFKLLGVDLQISDGPDGYVSLRPFTLAERNRYSTANVQTWIGVTNLRYRLSGNKLWFTPSPQTGQKIRIWYIPRLAELVDDVTLTVASQPIAGDFISIGTTTLSSSASLTVTGPVSGDYITLSAPLLNAPIDMMMNGATLTVSGATAPASVTIGSTTLSSPGDFAIVPGDDDQTATNLAAAINFNVISGVAASPSGNVISLTQSSTDSLFLSSSNLAQFAFSATKIAFTWSSGATDAETATSLASAINGLGLGITASALANVVSFPVVTAGPFTVSSGNYSNPVFPGVATRLAWSSPSLTAGWVIGASTSETAVNLAAAINAAAIPDVVAAANSGVITLRQDGEGDLSLSAGNSFGSLGASLRLQFSEPTLPAGSIVADGVSGWLEYVVTDAAIKMMQKEESDTSTLQFQKQALIKRIEAAAENRDAGSPATVADVQWTNGTWPFGNGFGGGGGIP